MTRFYTTIRPYPLAAVLALAATLAAPPALPGQSDRPVSTSRHKDAPGVSDAFLSKVSLSDQPRYFLDTIDNLNRVTGDSTRTAPGLAKNNYVVKVYPIYNTRAIEIQSYLLRSVAYEGGVVEVMGAEGVKDPDGNSVEFLYVTAPDFMIPGITEVVRMSDRPGFHFFDATGLDFGGGPGAVQYVGRHRTASELVAILEGTELGNIGAFLFPPFADDSTNTIYIVDNPTDIADNIAALEMFDRPPLQIELEVNIYEIEEGDRSKLGLDWDAWKGFFGGSIEYSSLSGSSFFDSRSDVYSSLLTLDARVLADFLNYTTQTGTTRVVTSTKLTMVNSEDNPGGLTGGGRGSSTGNPAIIESLTYIPYTVFQEDAGPVNSPNNRNELTDAVWEGVRLEILPFIGTESITLSVDVQVNSHIGYSKNKDIPLISRRNLNSIVNLTNTEPVVLGGLDKQNTVDSRVGIPLLKEIPYLGLLFSKESNNTSTSKVLISIVPRIKTSDTLADASM